MPMMFRSPLAANYYLIKSVCPEGKLPDGCSRQVKRKLARIAEKLRDMETRGTGKQTPPQFYTPPELVQPEDEKPKVNESDDQKKEREDLILKRDAQDFMLLREHGFPFYRGQALPRNRAERRKLAYLKKTRTSHFASTASDAHKTRGL